MMHDIGIIMKQCQIDRSLTYFCSNAPLSEVEETKKSKMDRSVQFIGVRRVVHQVALAP